MHVEDQRRRPVRPLASSESLARRVPAEQYSHTRSRRRDPRAGGPGMRHRWLATSLAGVLALLATSASVTSAAERPLGINAVDGTSSADEVFTVAMTRLNESKLSGFAGSARHDDGTYEIRWKKPLPTSVVDALAPDQDLVRLVPADFSQADVISASEALLDQARQRTVPDIAAVAASTDGTGLIVEVEESVLASQPVGDLEAWYSKAVNMPVQVREGAKPEPSSGRQDDSSPWNGGGLIRDPSNPNTLYCSLGFGAVNSSGYGRMLSARHCDTSGNIAWRNGNLEPHTLGGTAVSVKTTNDTMMIDPVGGSAGWVFGGKWNEPFGTARYDFEVARDLNSSEGIYVCTSGANSGEHCNLRVDGDTGIVTWTCGPAFCHGWRATENDADPAVSHVGGDSGGPVYQMRSDGRVNAVGIIYGGTWAGTCPSSRRFAVTNCWRTTWYNDVQMVLASWNLVIAASP